MGKATGKVIMVMLESLSGSGHKYVKLRPRLADKLERVMWDPLDATVNEETKAVQKL